MIRSITLILLCSAFHCGFSQQKDFERFMKDLDSCKAHNKHVVYEDSLISKNNYVLKWTHITGTYGGSQYNADGELIEAKSEADTLLPVINLYALDYPMTTPEGYSVEIIGDQYLIETLIYPEPKPTSNQHFIYVIRYFVTKEH